MNLTRSRPYEYVFSKRSMRNRCQSLTLKIYKFYLRRTYENGISIFYLTLFNTNM